MTIRQGKSQFELEALEPRILLSSDPLLEGVAGASYSAVAGLQAEVSRHSANPVADSQALDDVTEVELKWMDSSESSPQRSATDSSLNSQTISASVSPQDSSSNAAATTDQS